ncbi:MAG: hypothetical protein PHU91_03865 [Candidatus Omnitrophica bacterium]|nr:hypothetical protein [Candidatus Omnitrophota bacterium]MDD5236778.1 hypothetical protein [Candidatus Omnitrophota bacterium]MDD5611311.1 hypothetical protein [Candidatus Omnitrophota bacterium]
MKIIKIVFIIILLLNVCLFQVSPASADEFADKLYRIRWIDYSPTNFDPNRGIYPTTSSIEEDLRVLFNAGFRGIVTYGADNILAEIPEIAKRFGFEGVIMGIWDIYSRQEMQAAIDVSEYVDGYCLGNEGLGRRYEMEELIKMMDYLKAAGGKPVTTTEEITDYANDKVVKLGDWVFPNIHPIFFNAKEPKKAVDFITHYYKIICRAAKGKPILVKEAGYPTKGDVYANQKNQSLFFKLLEKSEVNFVYFEAFDQHWKENPEFEAHWGLFDKNRRPKRFIWQKINKKE